MNSSREHRPNLFVIGAAKAGTTSLHSHLATHPNVFMSDPKEPAFFVPEIDWRPKDLGWYLGLFEEAGAAKIIGESSTHYTKIPIYEGVPERIDQFCENPRFIYVVRDPIDRIVSHYWYEVEGGVEHRTILKAALEDPKYRKISDYKMQLEPYFELFGRDRVLVVTFERLITEQEAVLGRIYAWLDLDPQLAELVLPRENQRPEEVQMRRGFGLLDRFSRSSFWESVHSFTPSFVKSLGSRLARQKVNPSAVDDQYLIERLRPEFQGKVLELESFLGRQFPEWTTTIPSRRQTASRSAD